MARPLEITRLEQAIEAFEARMPNDLPDGFAEKLGELKQQLGEHEPQGDASPGQQAVANATGATEGTGVHYSRAARGPDKPSPGQREALGVSADIEEAAASISDRLRRQRGDGEGTAGAE